MNIRRLRALIAKERKQLFRDPASMVFGIFLPIILLLVFGYALSMDIRGIRLVIVEPVRSEIGAEIIARFRASEYFIVNIVRTSAEGTEEMRSHRAQACLFLPDNLQRGFEHGELSLMIAVNATNAMQGRLSENYIRGILRGVLAAGESGGLTVTSRMWFNESNDSRMYMLPGVVALIMTIIGTKLTSMIMAGEYEHGNLESMFVTPMTGGEILIAKALNNFLLGMVGLGLALALAHLLFDVPLRGSLPILVFGSAVYLVMALSLGLVISSVTKNQFLASEISIVVSFMPVMLLSGFVYEIPNMPVFIQYITYLVPARYYVDFLQTIFLVGNVWSNICFNIGMIVLFAVAMLVIAKIKNPKNLESC